jgi:hypothetical protein
MSVSPGGRWILYAKELEESDILLLNSAVN